MTNLLIFNERTKVSGIPKRLLFAYDLSGKADKGLTEAIKFARQLLHTSPLPVLVVKD